MKRKLVLLAVDAFIIRKGVTSLVNSLPGACLLKECLPSEDLAEELKTLSPDYCLLSEDAFSRIKPLLASSPEWYARLILVSSKKLQPDADRPFCEILSTGDSYENLMSKLSPLFFSDGEDTMSTSGETLSNREKTILTYLCKGFTNRQIAEKLFLSGHTVNTHRKNISNKLGIRSLAGLTVYAILNNLISIEEIAENPEAGDEHEHIIS